MKDKIPFSYLFKTLKIYIRHSLRYKTLTVVVLASTFLASITNVIMPIFLRDFINTLSLGEPNDKIVSSLIAILVMIALVDFSHWLFWRISTFAYTFYQAKIMEDLSNMSFKYLHQHSFSYFDNNFVGSLVKRVQWFIRAFETVADKIIYNLLPLAINVTFIIVVLFFINFWLALVVIIWLALFLIFIIIFIAYKMKFDIQRSQAETEMTGYLADSITNHANVRLFNGFGLAIKGFGDLAAKLKRLRRFNWNLDNLVDTIQGGMMLGLNVGLLFLAIKLWEQKLITIGDFVLLQTYLLNIFQRIWDVGKVFRDIYSNLADAQEMTQIIETPQDVQDVKNAKKLKVNQAQIEFKNVRFAYGDGDDILEKLNLSIQSGEKIALIGPSGAGKTTTVRLLLRMHDLLSGKVLIDGQDISKVTQESLWENISLVPQDPILFHRPLIDNIRYGKPSATDEEVILAAKAAHCHEFIVGLEHGYDTYVGERGIKLSGGERQRVAIARAILRNAPILILDEATSSLDSESEGFIQDALEKLMKDKTVIIIAHRLSTIKKMDRIIVIDDGNVVEEGTHKELKMLDKGIYQKLWDLQAGGFN